ncbi:hypothetical protein BJ912DRAFT_938870 [Pholiota molesta]|nr:hypothetical protein BJ912DRAFT_938870 [Pholiota molesta]
MLQWYRFVPDTVIFHITGLVLRICETLVIPSLVKYRFSHTVVESCRQLVDLTMGDFTKDLDELGRIRLMQRFHFRVLDYAAYLQNVEDLNGAHCDCYGELMRGCETKAMQLCSIISFLTVYIRFLVFFFFFFFLAALHFSSLKKSCFMITAF